jgi:hypothetical protein
MGLDALSSRGEGRVPIRPYDGFPTLALVYCHTPLHRRLAKTPLSGLLVNRFRR